MGTSDSSSDPLDSLKLAILNFKVKFVIWHSKRPHAVKAGVILLLLCGFLATNVRITIVSSESASTSRTKSIREHRLQRNNKLRTIFNPESPVLLDLDGIRDPYPTDLEEYKVGSCHHENWCLNTASESIFLPCVLAKMNRFDENYYIFNLFEKYSTQLTWFEVFAFALKNFWPGI
jgi:hypothetical protein